jgi:hypothetical protein
MPALTPNTRVHPPDRSALSWWSWPRAVLLCGLRVTRSVIRTGSEENSDHSSSGSLRLFGADRGVPMLRTVSVGRNNSMMFRSVSTAIGIQEKQPCTSPMKRNWCGRHIW